MCTLLLKKYYQFCNKTGYSVIIHNKIIVKYTKFNNYKGGGGGTSPGTLLLQSDTLFIFSKSISIMFEH